MSKIISSGKYIATESFTNKKIIASGIDLVKVYNKAKKKVSDPVIDFIPNENIGFCPSIFKFDD